MDPLGGRRRALGLGVALLTGGALLWAGRSPTVRAFLRGRGDAELAALLAEVLPGAGVELPVRFGDAVPRMVAAGAISPARFERLYAARGGVPGWVRSLFERPSADPIRISAASAPWLLNLLWPLGLSNRTAFNAQSSLSSATLRSNLASTGGWRLGERPGSELFNSAEIVALDSAAEAAVERAARASFRPCCDNSTFFQDCNHGSALLGLYELAAAQGAGAPELFRIGKVANSYWFPQQYAATAIYFRRFEDLGWTKVDPARLMGRRYSSATGWLRNVDTRLGAKQLRRGAGSTGSDC